MRTSKVQMLEKVLFLCNIELSNLNLVHKQNQLGSSEAATAVATIVNAKLKMYLEDYPKETAMRL